MKTDTATTLFNTRSHNPSFRAVKDSGCYRGELQDFCVPANMHFPPAAMVDMIHQNLDEILKYYPDYAEVHEKHIASLIDLAPETIVAANGSTEIITMLCQEAAGPMVTSVPTFGRWTDLPFELNVPLHTIQRKRENSFRLSIDEIVHTVRRVGARTLILSNPNNPTGASFSLADIKLLSAQLADLHAIIVDESFIDFSGLESAARHAIDTHNLVVVKSMGKSLGWHGIRLGYAVAQPKRARELRSRLPYWNINGLAAFVLKSVTRFKDEYQASFLKVAEDRAYMFDRLSSIADLTVYPSDANFLFVELPDGVSGRALRDNLLTYHGIMVRETSNKVGSTEQYLRLSVHAPAAVDALVDALDAELSAMQGHCVALSA